MSEKSSTTGAGDRALSSRDEASERLLNLIAQLLARRWLQSQYEKKRSAEGDSGSRKKVTRAKRPKSS